MSEKPEYVTIIHVIGTGSEAGTNYQVQADMSVFEVVKMLANEAGLKKFVATINGLPVDPEGAKEQAIGDLVGDKESATIVTARRAVAA